MGRKPIYEIDDKKIDFTNKKDRSKYASLTLRSKIKAYKEREPQHIIEYLNRQQSYIDLFNTIKTTIETNHELCNIRDSIRCEYMKYMRQVASNNIQVVALKRKLRLLKQILKKQYYKEKKDQRRGV